MNQKSNNFILFAFIFFFFLKKKGLKKGDIVISKCPSDPENDICKRIIYTPLETTDYYGMKAIP